MTEMPNDASEKPFFQQSSFEEITQIVSSEFQIEEALLAHDVPTYYLRQPQETKHPFLRLLKKLGSKDLIALLQKDAGKLVLRVISKPPTKSSSIWVNWALFFATIATTFYTGFWLSGEFAKDGIAINPFLGGAAFAAAIMAVLGTHEMGHKLTANKRNMDATPPYFIPGPPPSYSGFGTFGAVIMQKSLPPNRDALFDVGASGPLVGFFASMIATLVGLLFSPAAYRLPEGPFTPVPLLFVILGRLLESAGVFATGNTLLLHPVVYAGIIGMIVTMLNLLPTGMLDGGHVAKSVLGDKMRAILTIVSLVFLIVNGYLSMAILVLFFSLFKHPGSLDQVSPISNRRKYTILALLVVFLLCGITISTPASHIQINAGFTGPLSAQSIAFQIYYADSIYANCTLNQNLEWDTVLERGTYIICFPASVSINGTLLGFSNWEDGTSNPNRTIVLDHDLSIIATYGAISLH